MATSTGASRMATGGHLLLVLMCTGATWIRPRRMSALWVTVPVVTVLPFAVWYGRGEIYPFSDIIQIHDYSTSNSGSAMIWLPVVGNYADIDVYASIIAYEDLLNQRNKPARNYIPVAPNYSVPDFLRLPEAENKNFNLAPETDQVIILDISNPDQIHKFVNNSQILELIDHHPGFEEYWQKEIGDRAIIEKIGAVATSIFEWWGKCWDYSKMSIPVANLLLGAILDNTLNFNAKITTDRDREAAQELAKISDTTLEEFTKNYFSAVSETVTKNIKESLTKDIKIDSTLTIAPDLAFAQLALWDVSGVTKQTDEFHNIMNRLRQNWIINIIDIHERKNYILSSSRTISNYFAKLLNLKVQKGWLISNQLYLRKEIIAKMLTSQAKI